MSINKEIIETEVRTTTSQSQAELAKLEGSTGALVYKNKQLRMAMAKLEADGKKNSDTWKGLNNLYKENSTAITQNKAKMELLRKEIGITGLSANQLTKRANELKRELNSMTKEANPDRWKKLNAELKATQGQMAKVKAGAETTKSGFAGLKSLLPALGFAAVGAAVLKFTKNVLNANDTLQDKYNKAITIAKEVTDEFFRTIARGDFRNMLTNLKNAAEAAGKYAEAMDIIEDRSRALGVEEAKFNVFKQEQLKILRNVLLTETERIAAAKAIVDEENRLGAVRSDIAEQALDTKLILFETKGITRDIVEQNLLNYERNKDIINQADSYNALLKERKDIEAMGGAYYQSERYLEINKQIAETDEKILQFAAMRAQYGDLNGEKLNELAALYTNMYQAQASADENTQKTQANINSLTDQYIKKKESAAKKENDIEDKTAADLVKKREEVYRNFLQIQDDYLRSLQTKDEQEIDDIRRKYEKIIEAARQAGADKQAIATLEIQMQADIEAKILEQKKEKDDEKLRSEKEFQETKLAFRQQYELLSAEELETLEMARLQEGYDQKLISEEEFQKALEAIRKKYNDAQAQTNLEKRLEEIRKIKEQLAQIESIIQTSYEFIDTLRSADLIKLERQKQAEVRLAGDNADRLAEIDEEYAAREKELAKQYADIEFAIAIAGIITSTAAAIMNAWETGLQLPQPAGAILAGIETGMLIGLGAAQVYQANQQRQLVKQLAVGRYQVTGASDGRSYNAPWGGNMHTGVYTEPTLVADHGSEMVIDHPTLQNIQHNDPYLLHRIYSQRVSQHASGSYPDSATQESTTQSQTFIPDPGLINAITNLTKILSGGIQSHISYDEIQQAEDTMDNIESFASGEAKIIGYVTTIVPMSGGVPIINTPVYKSKRKSK